MKYLYPPMRDYHRNTDSVAAPVSRFMERTFKKVEITAPPGLLDRLSGCPVMVVCTHRSQADYFVAGYALYHQGIKYLRYAAGDNLTSLPYIGRRFRELGAFTVERGRTRDRAYLVQLPEQVAAMLLANENVLLFPEGGRSYGGGMMAVNQGVIGGAVLAQARNPARDIFFIPAAISYERLPELLYFPMLERGRRMRKKDNPRLVRLLGNVLYYGADAIAFAKFLAARRFGVSYGRVCIDIGEPFSVRSVVDLAANYNPRAPGEFWAHRASMKKIAEVIERRLHALYRLMPQHALASALMGQEEIARLDALERIPAIIARARERGRNAQELLAMPPEAVVDEGLRQLSSRRAAALRGCTIRVVNRMVIDYYAAALA